MPDVAYIAELLPDKKPNSFVIQTYKQINGEFLDENECISENILKLFGKLEEGETYHLILPDFLYTNTIISVAETTDQKIKSYIKEKLLPDLEITTDSHEIETFVLTEIKGESKVQVSALEKSLLVPIQVAATTHNITIAGASPLSWTLKSVISLEPSISVLQMGSTLFSALHYIGVDQATQTTVDTPEAIVETIKTLKGAEPSIQTIYLLSNSLVEEKLKELLSDTLPLQQLTSQKEDDTKLPPYVKQIIESGMKTLSINDYPVPKFKVPKATKDQIASIEGAATKTEGNDMPTSTLPKPNKDDATKEKETKSKEVEKETEEVVEATPEKTKEVSAKKDEKEKEANTDTETDKTDDPIVITSPLEEKATNEVKEKTEEKTEKNPEDKTEEKPEEKKSDSSDAIITQFAAPSASSDAPASPVVTTPVTSSPTTIKNKSGVKNMLKMIFITIAVFFVTVAVGIGVGLAILKFTGSSDMENQNPAAEEVSETTEETEPTPSPTPEPTPELDKTEVSLLVVNATTKAGYAGSVSDDLEAADFTDLSAGNAKGEYAEEGVYLLLSEENDELVAAVAEATKLDVKGMVGEEKDTEDPSGKYTAVLVLAK